MYYLTTNEDTAKPKGFSLITRGKNKNILFSHSTTRLGADKVVVSTERTDTKSVKDFEFNQAQADVYVHQKVAESLKNHSDDAMLPYISMTNIPHELRHIRERDILVRFRVPETSLSWNYDKINVAGFPAELSTDMDFYPTTGKNNFELAVLTIYPKDSGFFATFKTEKGYIGLSMSHWVSLVQLWKETVVTTEIAVLIDSDAQGHLPGLGSTSNKSGFTPLGVISGFFNGNVEQYNHPETLKRLLSAAMFTDSRPLCGVTDDDRYGFGYSLHSHSISRLDCRRAVVMEILDFDTVTESWELGFSDVREVVTTIPYNYSDFLAKGYHVTVVALVNKGVLGKVLSYQFYSSSLDGECLVSQLDC